MKKAIVYAVCITTLLALAWGRVSAAPICFNLEYAANPPTTLMVVFTDFEEGFAKFIGEHMCTDPQPGAMPASSPAEGTGHPTQDGKIHLGVITHGGPSGYYQDSCPVSTLELVLAPAAGGLSGSGTIFFHSNGVIDDVTAVQVVSCSPLPR